jgi:hypothetical protein
MERVEHSVTLRRSVLSTTADGDELHVPVTPLRRGTPRREQRHTADLRERHWLTVGPQPAEVVDDEADP